LTAVGGARPASREGAVRTGPLSGIKVVELASETAAQAGKLLADLGAEVVVVEPPGGHATRAIGPFRDDRPQPDQSLWWWSYNTSKKGVALDLESQDDRSIFLGLIERADLVLEAETPGSLQGRGIDRSQIMEVDPRLIWVSVSPFGQESTRSKEPFTDLTLMSGGGPVWNCGYDDHSLPPVRGGGSQAANIAGVHAVMAALVAVVHRDATGEGQHVDVNMHAALNVTTEVGSYEWLVAQNTVQRQTGRHASVSPTARSQVRAADGGYVVLGFPPRSADDYQSILSWLDELGLADRFPDRVLLELAVDRGGVKMTELGTDPVAMECWNAGRAAMSTIASSLGAYECFEGFQQRGIVCGIVYDPEDTVSDKHFVARGFPTPVYHDDLDRTYTYPGAPLSFSRSPWRIASRAPHVDEDRAEVLGWIESGHRVEGDMMLTDAEGARASVDAPPEDDL
jgi:crotonobetainyl-CoA:carnitine CoA-transferase CaiB-like acyl-CoA transferase